MNKLSVYLGFIFIYSLSLGIHAEKILVNNATSFTPSLNTHYTVRPDNRKCVSPICGGWYVKAVNQKTQKCPDGSIQNECYVGTDIISIPNLTPEQLLQLKQAMNESNALIEGSISNKLAYGVLVINQAWTSATHQQAEGTFLNVKNNGIVCITYPCPSYDGLILNKKIIKSLSDIDLTQVQASSQDLDLAQAAINSNEGLYMAGHYTDVTGPAGTAQGIAATQFYLKLSNTKPKYCQVTGCSNHICADSEVLTTCEWRPEYDCYKTASCSANTAGECGWVMDDELKKCLSDTSGFSLMTVDPEK